MEDNKEEVKEVKRRGRPRKNTTEENIKKESVKEENKEKSIKENKTTKTTRKTKREIAEKELEEMMEELNDGAKKVKKVKQKTTSKIEKKPRTKKATSKIEEKPQTNKTTSKNKKETKQNNKSTEKQKKLVVKDKSEETTINEKELEEIEQEIKNQTNISEDRKKKIIKTIFQNIVIAIAIIFYFIFINLGYCNINETKYLVDLKVFSVISIGITILLFEKAYKKDSGYITIYGIEILILSILTLLTSYFYVAHNNKFPYIMNCIAILYGVYYVGKSIVIYVKMKKSALKKTSDIRKIAK